MPEQNAVSTTRQGAVAVLTIDNPPANSMGLDVIAGLSAALDEVEKDRGVGAVVITGAGETGSSARGPTSSCSHRSTRPTTTILSSRRRGSSTGSRRSPRR